MASLRPVEFEILLALAAGPRHGYAIMQEIRDRGGEAVETGTLYRALQRLTESDLVRPVSTPREAADSDERRQYYSITAMGRKEASMEASRLAALVGVAREARLLPRGA